MRTLTAAILGLAMALPLTTLAVPARADTNDNGFLGQAQRFLNQGNGQSDQDAYERGRRDEARRQAERDREDRHEHRRAEAWRDRDHDRHRSDDYGYRADRNDVYPQR